MNKVITSLILGMFLVLAVTASVSADTSFIAGKIYNSGYTDVISGADVTVTCNGEIVTTESLSDGAYSVTYFGTNCIEGSTLTVSAVKGDLYGSKTGDIHSIGSTNWDFAVVNVPLVPEFGLIAGMVTILGALGMFFFVRKN
jgi:hypothetical protein